MGIELMLNACNINLVAFNRFLYNGQLNGMVFGIFNIVVAASEVAVGLAIIIALHRRHKSTNVDDIDLLKW